MPDTLPQRPTFSNGQYIGASDLNAAVDYARDETKRLSLSGHSWGIAAGLALVERTDTTGGVQMFIEPGIAWDGYGRPVVVLAPAPVTPDLFASLATGLQIVWLRYNVVSTQSVAPGFLACGAGDPTTRVAETYAIEAGNRTPNQRTDGVVIGGATVTDPRDALIAVDQSAAVVLDSSAPHQSFPDDTAHWLIPIGVASYVAGTPGSFAARSPAQLALSRAARRYIGAVAESVTAADGVLRLRDRQTDNPTALTDDQLDTAAAIQPADIGVDPNNATRLVGNELVWVEGNLRLTGHARLFGTQLELRDPAGQTGPDNAPEFLRRAVSPPNNTLGGQDLQICIGSSGGTAGMDRLTIGVVEPANPANAPSSTHPDGALDERMVIRTDGRVAIGTNAIDSYDSKANNLVVAAAADSGITIVSGATNTGNIYFADGTAGSAQKAGFVTYDHTAQQLQLGAGATQVLSLTSSGQVVIGPDDPTAFASDADQLIVSSVDGPCGVTIAPKQGTAGRIDFADGTVTPNAGFLRYDLAKNLMEFGTNAQRQVFINANGRLGIGTDSPDAPLQVMSASDSHSLKLNSTSIQATDGGTTSPLLLQPDGQGVGVGLATPNATLHVRTTGSGPSLRVDSNGAPSLSAVGDSVGVGFAVTPRTTLDVQGIIPGAAAPSLAEHVAIVENIFAGSGDVLALKVNAGFIGPPFAAVACNFVTFFDGAGNAVGAIEGAGAGVFQNTVTYSAFQSADYAEAVIRAPDTPPIGPGRIVGVRGGQVSLVTDGADAVFVTTDRPAVLGNAPPRETRDAYEMLAFIGQVGVTVEGPVAPGDLIVASGKADGAGRAIPLAKVEADHLALIVGRAWEKADGRATRRVNALVGPGAAHTAATAAVLARQAREIERLSALVSRRRPAQESKPAREKEK
jgi:hypothetical protein